MTNEDIPELNTIWEEARASIEQGDYDKAIDTYRYVLIRYADGPVAVEHANAYLGDVFLTLRNLDEAERHIKKAIGLAPERPDYRYILGFIYSVGGRWKEAIPEFEKTLEKQPHNAEYLRGLGWAVHSGGDAARGLTYLEEAVRLQPTNVNIMTDLAVAHMSSHQFQKAREYAEMAVRNAPANPTARDILNKILSLEKRFGRQDWTDLQESPSAGSHRPTLT